MESKVEPAGAPDDRLAIYRRVSRLGLLGESYTGKFALAAFLGVVVPLAVFVLYLLFSRSDWQAMYPALAALMLACFAGFLGTLWLLRGLLVPIDLTVEALRDYIERRKLPELPVDLPDRAGRLMEGTQYTLTQLHEVINRLERVSDTDDLTGVYNRRAGEKRLAEEVARAERDLQSFQLAFFDIDDFKAINDLHGHAAGDSCIAHLAQVLLRNTRRVDWVSRWGGDEFVVGLHRNHALKPVMDRIAAAIGAARCEVATGVELRLAVSCGVAEYRFGSGAAGVLADADKAMYAAKELGRLDGGSHVCYRSQQVREAAAAAAPPVRASD